MSRFESRKEFFFPSFFFAGVRAYFRIFDYDLWTRVRKECTSPCSSPAPHPQPCSKGRKFLKGIRGPAFETMSMNKLSLTDKCRLMETDKE